MNFWQKYKIYIKHPLDQILRYLPIIDYLEKNKSNTTKILEIGSGDYGITEFYPINITAVDIGFNKPNFPYITPVISSATNLPFDNESFEVVISIDMIEHLSTVDRVLAIKEMIRVASRTVIVAFPNGLKTEIYEKRFNAVYQKYCGVDHPWLKEHILNGLPKVLEIIKIIEQNCEKNGKKYQIKTIKNVNIIFWYLVRIANLPWNYFLIPLRGRFAPLLIGLWKYLNFGYCYRKIITVEFL